MSKKYPRTLEEVVESIETYLRFVTTDVEERMAYEPELYAAYAIGQDLTVSTIKYWYEEAEYNFYAHASIVDSLPVEQRDDDVYRVGDYWFYHN